MFRKILLFFPDLLFGSSRLYSLEHRTFNIMTSINGSINIATSFLNYFEPNSLFSYGDTSVLFWLHFLSGLLFIFLYFSSRVLSVYRSLFLVLMFGLYIFLFFNVLYNGGSQGGAHYYFITAIFIMNMLSKSVYLSIINTLVALSFVLGFFFIETYHPEYIVKITDNAMRLEDVSGNYIFLILLNSFLFWTLKRSYDAEREKSEKLLLNILPPNVAEELKRTDNVFPVLHEKTSVLFSDFVAFTKHTEETSPSRIVEKLDYCFSGFDKIMRKYNLEKIKTIGDAYMVAGNLSVMNKLHHLEIILAALEMIEFVKKLKNSVLFKDDEAWEIRIGIHTGRLVSGVLGTEKLAYDIWGETVNIASRLETSSLPNRINISAELHKKVEQYFHFTHRGLLPVKNIGEINMYLVDSLKEEYSSNENKCVPSKSLLEEIEYQKLRTIDYKEI